MITFLLVFAFLSVLMIALQVKYCIICDSGTANPRPYSLSRLQLVWWTTLVIACYSSIVILCGSAPNLTDSTLWLLGIGSLTTASARLIDISDQNSGNALISINSARQGFWLDILSDQTGVSIHRLQAVLFNALFGGWFFYTSCKNLELLKSSQLTADKVMPVIAQNNLILLGISAGTYVALKSTENK